MATEHIYWKLEDSILFIIIHNEPYAKKSECEVDFLKSAHQRAEGFFFWSAQQLYCTCLAFAPSFN